VSKVPITVVPSALKNNPVGTVSFADILIFLSNTDELTCQGIVKLYWNTLCALDPTIHIFVPSLFIYSACTDAS
jgi:hypothetical protein